MLFVSHRPN